MRKIKILCFIMALIFIVPLGLTACNKSSDVISTKGQILSHKEEFVEFSLLMGGYQTTDEDFPNAKQEACTILDNAVSNMEQGTLDVIAKDILSVCEIKNSFISNYLNSSISLIKAYNSLSKKAKEIYALGEETYNEKLLTALDSVITDYDYTALKGVFSLEEVLVLGGSQTSTFILSGYYNIENLIENMKLLEESNIGLTPYYQELWLEFKNTYETSLKLIDLFAEYYQAYIKFVINLAHDSNMMASLESISSSSFASLKELTTVLVEDYGIQNKDVKNAYLDFMLNYQGYNLNLETKVLASISFDLISKSVKDYVIATNYGENKPTTKEEFALLLCFDNNLRADCFNILNKVGNAISNNFMDDKTASSLVNSAKLLNQNGLGLFMDNYLDLYRYSINFMGHTLSNFTEKQFLEILTASFGLASSNAEKAQALVYKLSADSFLDLYNTYEKKSQLKNSFKDNEKFDNFITNINGMSNAISKKDIEDSGMLDFSKISDEQVEVVNTCYNNAKMVAGSWVALNKTHIQTGIAEIQKFSTPLLALTQQFEI